MKVVSVARIVSSTCMMNAVVSVLVLGRIRGHYGLCSIACYQRGDNRR